MHGSQVLFGVILPFKDKTQIQKSGPLKSCLREVSEGVQSLVKLIQMMNENNTFVNFAFYMDFRI